MRREYDREDSSVANKLTYLLIGGGIGAVIALLFAPKSGIELREDIIEDVTPVVDAPADAQPEPPMLHDGIPLSEVAANLRARRSVVARLFREGALPPRERLGERWLTTAEFCASANVSRNTADKIIVSDLRPTERVDVARQSSRYRVWRVDPKAVARLKRRKDKR